MRRHLRFSIDEWLALPWWQRRVYIEGLQEEADARERNGAAGGAGGAKMDPLDAIYNGSLTDAQGALGTRR